MNSLEEIKVGEYVRTTNKGIRQIAMIDNHKTVNKYLYYIGEDFEGKSYAYIKTTEILKHSFNLIDLIEVGDIVKDEYNKYEVAFVKDDKIYCNDYNLDDSLITLREQDIKAILTKEQMEDNCYKVGGEDEFWRYKEHEQKRIWAIYV